MKAETKIMTRVRMAALLCGAALLGSGWAWAQVQNRDNALPAIEPTAGPVTETATGAATVSEVYGPHKPKREPLPPGFAGQYLASHFAQSAYDWAAANTYLNAVLAGDAANTDLLRRSMILAMGAGDVVLASQRAQELIALEKGDGLALLILAVGEIATGRMAEAEAHLELMQAGDMTDFVKPILKGWATAAQGRFDLAGFNETAIHRYHAGLISVFMKKDDKIREYAEALLAIGTLSNIDAERTADLLAVLGRYDEAKVLYEGVFAQDGQNQRLARKLEEIRKDSGGAIRDQIEALRVTTAQQGAALALYDMAYILFQENSDSSAKLFAQMTIVLNPAMTDAHLLLSDTLSRNGRLGEAITQLGNVPPGHPSYMEVQRHIAELLAEAGREKEAIEKLGRLFADHNDVESLIRIGDLYRQKEDFRGALTAYNKAAKHIGKTIPEEYWYLLYARGMAYERQGDWKNAETDLKAALGYRPNHPYLLNYLGYGWADQGLNLEESLELIKRAVALQPQDGYIIDSLGWVQYMMGDFEAALPNLERAVELLPYDSTINEHLGDAYWQMGRRMEARFQWQRAINYSEDKSLSANLEHKLRFGLEGMEEVKQAGAQ